MTALRNEQLIAPPESQAETELARNSSRLLAACIGHGPTARLRVIDDKETIEVPVAALRMLVDILANMAAGNAVSLVPIHAELTTQQAADFLNVSRPYLIGVLDRGELAHHKVGTHRRIYFRDLREYKRVSHEKALQSLAAMTAEAQELGLYD